MTETASAEQSALNAYWAAKTPAEERSAIDRMKFLGIWKEDAAQTGDLRTLTFTIGQLRDTLLAYAFASAPCSLTVARSEIDQLLEQEWIRQNGERQR